jgi:hypothetical protein
MEWVW